MRGKPIILLLPDAESHGAFTVDMIERIVTNEWVKKWKLDQKVAEWSAEWGTPDVEAPTAEQIRAALFRYSPLEWSRLSPFQDRILVVICQHFTRAVRPSLCFTESPEKPAPERPNIYLENSVSFPQLSKGQTAVKLYCSPHNPGAAELAAELISRAQSSTTGWKRSSALQSTMLLTSGAFMNSRLERGRGSSASSLSASSSRCMDLPSVSEKSAKSTELNQQRRRDSIQKGWGAPFEVVDSLATCHTMLLCFNALTWAHNPWILAGEILEAQHLGIHVQFCHEFPSVLDPTNSRQAIDFDTIIETTPAQLQRGGATIYAKQVAIALKGGEMREPGLALLAQALIKRHRATAILSRSAKKLLALASGCVSRSTAFTSASFRLEPSHDSSLPAIPPSPRERACSQSSFV